MYLLPFNDKCELYVGNNVLMLLDSSCTTLCSIRISVCIISMRKDLSFVILIDLYLKVGFSIFRQAGGCQPKNRMGYSFII